MNANHRRVVLITGASSGIGKATALGLAQQGAHVIMVCRDTQRGERARAQIIRASRSEAVDLVIADLSSQREIRALAETIHTRYSELHVLINNAGVMRQHRDITVDGIEVTFALNHLAPFLLTHLLLDLLIASAPAQVVNVASSAAFEGTLDFDDLMSEHGYTRRGAYSQSKLANIVFTRAMARVTSGSGVRVNCLHPGNVVTNLGGPGRRVWLWHKRLFKPAAYAALNLKRVEQAAQDVIALATSQVAGDASGAYVANNAIQELPLAATDEAVMQRLWQVSAELTHLDVDALPIK